MSKSMVYVCSPLSAETVPEMRRNMHNARRLMIEIAAETGKRAVAPHAFLPEFLDDGDPEERELALDIGTMLLKNCCCLIVCAEKLSNGMRAEINQAKALGIPVVRRVAPHIYLDSPVISTDFKRKEA